MNTRPPAIRPACFQALRTLALLAAALAGGAAAPAATLPEKTVPLAFGLQLKPKDTAPESLDAVKDAGFRLVRRGFNWEAIEKEKGVYDFGASDAFLEEARKRGLRVLGCIAFGNKLYGPVREAAGRDAYAAFAAALARRYKDHNVLWELWNEPNTLTFWGRHGKKGNTEAYAVEYTELVKKAVPAMREADPGCFVMAGSVSCLWSESYVWIDACFQHGIRDAGISAWSVHPYSSKSPEENIPKFAEVRSIQAKHGVTGLPLLNSERGYPIRKAEGWAGGPDSLAPEFQAWHLVRQHLVDLLCDLRTTVWYEWSGDDFGIAPPGGKPRPALLAAKVLAEQLDGYALSRRLPLESPADFALLFEKASGEQKVVAWTSPPDGQPPDKAVPHPIDLAVAGAGPFGVCDLYGKTATVAAKGGHITVTLAGAPQYITLRAAAPRKP
jgi:hypothetical protein